VVIARIVVVVARIVEEILATKVEVGVLALRPKSIKPS
jgi:hypothetical protein